MWPIFSLAVRNGKSVSNLEQKENNQLVHRNKDDRQPDSAVKNRYSVHFSPNHRTVSGRLSGFLRFHQSCQN